MKVYSLFTAFYNSFYWFLIVITAGLLAITPADTIKQAHDNKQLYNVFVIASCYFATGLVASLLWVVRRFTRRVVLRGIPKTWIPVEKGDVNKKVRKMIASGLSRSAVIAWDSRPRVNQHTSTIASNQNAQAADAVATVSVQSEQQRDKEQAENEFILAEKPVWGEISHKGWSSPTSSDLPSLQYTAVILELPHLIEAKAVSLAPPDLQSTSEPPMPDLRAVDILQRPAAMGLRDYISHLTSFGVISSPDVATSFLSSYEYARFSSNPLSETEFRDLMKQFAEVLRGMEALSPAIITSLDIDGESYIDGDASSSTTSGSTPVTPESRSLTSSLRSVSIRSGSEGTIRTAPSRRPDTNHTTSNRNSRAGTFFGTPRSRKRLNTASSNQDGRLYTSSSSSSSMRSMSQTSVIKLTRSHTNGELPYTINIPGLQ